MADEREIQNVPLRWIGGFHISRVAVGENGEPTDIVTGRLPREIAYASLLGGDNSRFVTGQNQPTAAFVLSRGNTDREMIGFLTLADLKEMVAAMEKLA